MCVCMCAVFVFGVDDYQSQAVFRPDLGYASAFLCSGSTPGPEKKPFERVGVWKVLITIFYSLKGDDN